MTRFLYEYGLFEPVETTHYFSVAGSLYAGNAVIFAYDEAGETCDVASDPAVTFLTGDEAKNAIVMGHVRRPKIAVNGEVFWQWPNPPPEDMARRMAEKRNAQP